MLPAAFHGGKAPRTRSGCEKHLLGTTIDNTWVKMDQRRNHIEKLQMVCCFVDSRLGFGVDRL